MSGSRIDWALAERVAGATGGGSGDTSPLSADLEWMALDAAARVVAYTGLKPAGTLPRAEAVDRRQWRAANYAAFDAMLGPVIDNAGAGLGPLQGPVMAGAGALVGAEAGAVTGLLGRRVLGQVDVRLTDPAAPLRLLLVVPNLHAAATVLGVDELQLVRWVTVHEVTHAVQFTAVPWLRGHLGGMLGELLDAAGPSLDVNALLRLPSLEDVRSVMEQVRRGSLLSLVVGPGRTELLERMQATMALVEGHAEHVMDAAGAEVIPDLARLREALQARRASGDGFGPWRILERLLGMELKLKQYEDGKRFCDAVVAQAGVPALHQAFDAPDSLPTAAELADPDAWVSRMG
ncbi:MAG: hypothetical protein JWO02_4651 [Solirubrobacterales bacterium]|nr:hypothetical protein [Solirubrobacterales bacterium]